MIAISKALETYSEALTYEGNSSPKFMLKYFLRRSSWRNIDTTSLGNLVQQLLTFAWDHFSYNVEVNPPRKTNFIFRSWRI